MKIINLNKLKTIQTVELDGTQYEVRGISVGTYLNDTDYANFTSGRDDLTVKEQVDGIINVLKSQTNIPEEVLYQQELTVLLALISVMQGNDPTEEKTEGDAGPNA